MLSFGCLLLPGVGGSGGSGGGGGGLIHAGKGTFPGTEKVRLPSCWDSVEHCRFSEVLVAPVVGQKGIPKCQKL